MSEACPESIALHVKFRGKLQRYGQLCYGSENSRRITIVLDQIAEDRFDVYVDRDCDGIVRPDELLPDGGSSWQVDLDAEVGAADAWKRFLRRVEFQLAATRDRLMVATTGCIVGQASLGGGPDDRQLSVQRVDGDANGLFSDARDRIRIDLDGDGCFDTLVE